MPCLVPAMVSNKPRIEIETNSKSKSILDPCLSQYRNQHQYFTQAWVNIKTNIRNRKFEFNTNTGIETNQFCLSLLHTPFPLPTLAFPWFSPFDVPPLLGTILAPPLHAHAIKINTWLMSRSKPKPKPTPILHPSLSQYQSQCSKSKIRIRYQYWSRNQPVSPIPAQNSN